MKNKNDDEANAIVTWHNLLITIVGGAGLLFATLFFNAFVSSPPSRAEFNELKARTEQTIMNIDKRLERIENGQREILNTLIER
jgi:hypothetical protein